MLVSIDLCLTLFIYSVFESISLSLSLSHLSVDAESTHDQYHIFTLTMEPCAIYYPIPVKNDAN